MDSTDYRRMSLADLHVRECELLTLRVRLLADIDASARGDTWLYHGRSSGGQLPGVESELSRIRQEHMRRDGYRVTC